ncbi:hypothetical protein JQC67_12490 [Aurantibacter crassamenti]|uniref:hypothetical protein n=1 Tax=Aurantibacter crassamenti TaxID=1837375 RepID=UPI00193AD47F|nr:hypothetical protein [Aurantibacter crassamenti]MBM1106961.1 hypothetical protein [Aurantibacter crassamenti]
MKKIISVFSNILAIVGVIGFWSGSYFYNENTEIPLGDIKGFVVDKENNIYVGSGFYEKVQVYDEDGNFLKNWDLEAYGGTFTMNLTEHEEILITTARGNEQIWFNKNGRILSQKKIGNGTYEESKRDWRTFTTKENVQYEIKGTIFHELVRLNPKKTIINQNLFLQIIKGPFNIWLLIVIGGIISYLLKVKK